MKPSGIEIVETTTFIVFKLSWSGLRQLRFHSMFLFILALSARLTWSFLIGSIRTRVLIFGTSRNGTLVGFLWRLKYRNLSLVRRGAAPRSQAFVSVISGWSE